jgi:hypothetical protein
MSEKIDGIRVYWDGSTKDGKMRTLAGKALRAPEWLKQDMPHHIIIDGVISYVLLSIFYNIFQLWY